MYVYAFVSVLGQKRAMHPLDLKLQAVVSCATWVQGTKLRFFKEQLVLLTAYTFL